MPYAVCLFALLGACARFGYAEDSPTDELGVDAGVTASEVANGLSGSASAPPAPFVTTCLDVKLAFGVSDDGTYAIDPDGTGPAESLDVYCHNMSGDDPLEYLDVSPLTNYTVYAGGAACPCSDLIRRYDRVRFMPSQLSIETSDQTFSTLEENTACVDTIGFPHCAHGRNLNFGMAGSCIGNSNSSGRASIDLQTTPFAIEPSSPFAPWGNQPAGSIVYASANQQASISGGGYCGWFGPQQTEPTGTPGASAPLRLTLKP